MDITVSSDHYTAEERAVIFFRHVKRDLGVPATKDILNLVGNVLSHVCNGMSPQNETNLIKQMPEVIQLLMCSGWKSMSPRKNYSHLDELVEDIYAADCHSENRLFFTEVHVLYSVVVILRKLDKYLNVFSMNILKPQMVEGLKQIPLEEAA